MSKIRMNGRGYDTLDPNLPASVQEVLRRSKAQDSPPERGEKVNQRLYQDHTGTVVAQMTDGAKVPLVSEEGLRRGMNVSAMASQIGLEDSGGYFPADTVEAALQYSALALAEKTGHGVLSGLAVTAQDTPDMTVGIGSGVAYLLSGRRVAPAAIAAQPIAAAHATVTRHDLIYINASGFPAYLQGYPAYPSNLPPPPPAGGVALAGIRVPAGSSAILSGNILDLRKNLWIENGIAPTLTSSWVESAGRPVLYYKDIFGIVRLAGRVTGGTVGSIMTLPSAYRPAHNYDSPGVYMIGGTRNLITITVTWEGVVFSSTVPAEGGVVNLDGVSFRAGV